MRERTGAISQSLQAAPGYQIVRLHWDPVLGVGTREYRVTRKAPGEADRVFTIDADEEPSFYDTGLVNGVSYDYLRANQKSLRYIVFNFIKLTVGIALNVYMICFLKWGVVSILLSTLITSVMIFVTLTLPVLKMTGLRLSGGR